MAVSRDSCTLCLLKELSDEAYGQTLKQYIEHIDEDIKTPEDIYEQRLSLCLGCEYLRNGICRLCGCFVAMRAAKIHSRCADTPVRWGDLKAGV